MTRKAGRNAQRARATKRPHTFRDAVSSVSVPVEQVAQLSRENDRLAHELAQAANGARDASAQLDGLNRANTALTAQVASLHPEPRPAPAHDSAPARRRSRCI